MKPLLRSSECSKTILRPSAKSHWMGQGFPRQAELWWTYQHARTALRPCFWKRSWCPQKTPRGKQLRMQGAPHRRAVWQWEEQNCTWPSSRSKSRRTKSSRKDQRQLTGPSSTSKAGCNCGVLCPLRPAGARLWDTEGYVMGLITQSKAHGRCNSDAPQTTRRQDHDAQQISH